MREFSALLEQKFIRVYQITVLHVPAWQQQYIEPNFKQDEL
jgi:DNA-binding transcriptional regulator YiaG